jgi:DNA-binding response OmpR family regulator
MTSKERQRRVLLVIGDSKVSDRLRRSLLRNGVWCAPARDRAEVLPTLRASEFCAAVLDLDDPSLDALSMLPALRTVAPHLRRIGLTRSSTLQGQLRGLAEQVLLHPIDMTELVAAIVDDQSDARLR